MKRIIYLLVMIVFVMTACKKDKDVTDTTQLSNDQLTVYASSAQTVYTEIMTFMSNQLSAAILAGMTIDNPPSSSKSIKSAILNFKTIKNTEGPQDWQGPDAGGWYTRSWDGVYTYTESYKVVDSTVWYKYSIEYDGGDGSYSNETTTHYTKVHKNHKILYQGESDWKISAFGDNDISDVEYDFTFMDWNPNTGAGTYDWFWSAQSLGGDFVPYHRFLSIIATEILYSEPPMLDETIRWYDDGGVEVGEWNFETDQVYVDMPQVPGFN